MRSLLLFGLLPAFASLTASAQSLEPRAVVPTGGSGESTGTSLSWTLGQPASATFTDGNAFATAGVQQPEGVQLSLNIAALLDGPYDASTDLMHDSLRTRGLLPLMEPFSAVGHPPVGMQGGAQLTPTALLNTGADALVDWVFVELRGADDASRIDAARAALLQRDGDVVDVDGVSPLRITVLPGSYHLALLHRNHLPVLTQAPITLGTGVNAFDLTTGSTTLHVPNAEAQRNGRYLLWSGDVNGDATVKYTGADNDRDPVLLTIGGTVPTNTVSGYLPADVNLDGTVKYTGVRNDRDPILLTIGGTVPTAVRVQPLP
ncbi:MAG: hypothetical protein IPN38_16165 [Flavobacteriales bacterium]|nr:hypothetical protein [Flavobacteriales bacterium]